MKKFALVALTAMAMLPACTAIHPERRTLTDWNWEMVVDHNHKVDAPKDSNSWTDSAYPVFDWVLVQPIQVALLPVSWVGDTFILNPIDAWKKAALDNHNDREGRYLGLSTSESGVKNYQYAPMIPPPFVSDALDYPRFLARFLWNATYWAADPVDQSAYESYWQRHHEMSSN